MPLTSRSNPPGRVGFFDVFDRISQRLFSLENTMKDVISFRRKTVADIDYTIDGSEIVVAYTSLSASRTVALPTSSSSNQGQRFIIKDESGSASGGVNIIVAAAGAQTIEGAATKSITSAYGIIRLYSTGAGWMTW